MSNLELFLRWWVEYQPVGLHDHVPNKDLYDDYIRWAKYMPNMKHADNIITFSSMLKNLNIEGFTYHNKQGHTGASVSIDIAKLLPQLPRKYFEL